MTISSAQSDEATDTPEYVDVLLYSDNSAVRREVIAAVGRRAAAGQPLLKWHEAATPDGALHLIKTEPIRLVVVDAETKKVGGLAFTRQLKTEVFNAPPVLALLARPQDEWLGHWSEAEALLTAPIQPRDLQTTVARFVDEALHAPAE